MKRITIKRLVYSDGYGNDFIGSTEYDGALDNYSILCAIHEIGKTVWIGDSLWMLRFGVPTYRVTVAPFYRYEKRWYELVWDALRRI